MKIGILGTRGIPNTYGGFEQFAQHLSEGLVNRGHEVWVYCSHLHPYQQHQWNGVQLIHCKDWEDKIGTAGQFVYDYNCFTDAGKRNFDVLLQLGYTSNSIWQHRWPGTVNIVNMDGLEWKRSKYNRMTQRFLKFAEKLAARNADVLIADSPGIKEYLLNTYRKNAVYIPYGAIASPPVNREILNQFQLDAFHYYLMVARMEPENNIEMVIGRYFHSSQKYPLVIVGNTDNEYGKKLVDIYQGEKIRFIGGIYEPVLLNSIRHFSAMHFHGHSVGGTNPSLLEAMGCECLIVAHDNIFNRAILGNEADFFANADAVTTALENELTLEEIRRRKSRNLEKIKQEFNWPGIIDEYEKLFFSAVRS